MGSSVRSRARGDRSRRVARSLVLLAAALTASLAALALPGSVSRDEAAVYRALVTNETVVIETRKPRQPACPDGSAAAACPVPSELAARFAEANLRRGYVDCHQLQLDYKRCVRWRQTRRPMFYGFPALVLSRPGISADGKSAVVYRELHKTASRGVRGWVLLARDVPDGAWRVVREHASVRF
jgi:hypothetical protein